MSSEINKEQIRKEAKTLLDNFASTLDSINYKEKTLKRPSGGFREEQEPHSPNKEFRVAMFANAPKKDSDNILAEKKQW